MKPFMRFMRWLRVPAACCLLVSSSLLHAQAVDGETRLPPLPLPAAETARLTVEAIAFHSQLDGGLPDGRAGNLRATWQLPSGDVLQGELLNETKFGVQGEVAALAWTHGWSGDWYSVATVALGSGGPNWIRQRVDLQLSRKWLHDRSLVTSLAGYHATFDGNRSDRGLRLSATWYLSAPAVLEVGTALNESAPGGVRSNMPWVSATLGREGQQYFSLRFSRGSEAYQALGSERQLVGFRSRALLLNWRRWIGPRWGASLHLENYANPSYSRETVGAGVFVQW